jgi:hypothetical protein
MLSNLLSRKAHPHFSRVDLDNERRLAASERCPLEPVPGIVKVIIWAIKMKL